MTDAVWLISRGAVEEDLAKLPLKIETTTGPVGFTTRADIPPSLPPVLLMQTIREAAKQKAAAE